MNKIRSFIDQHFLVIVIFFFAIVYSLISIVNHIQLRTYALDLGMFNHALYSFAHFKKAIFTLGIDGKEMPFLGTHFSPIMILYVPLYYIFGSYTLLVIQILVILSGGVVLYKMSLQHFDHKSIYPKIIVLHFFSIWGIYSALSFDFHNNVVAAMLVLWFFYFMQQRKLVLSSVFFVLVLLSQENMAIWMIFILIGIIIQNRKQFKINKLKFEISLLIIAVLYSYLIIRIVMPSFQESEVNMQFSRYSLLGNSFSEIIATTLKRPFYTISLLFKNTINDPVYDGIKMELHYMVIVSGGILLFFRPYYLLMLIPIYALKLFSNDYNFWGINLHYSIEFVPIISLAFIDILKSIKKYQKHVALGILILTVVFNIVKLNSRQSKWYDKTNSKFYSSRHYNPNLNLKEIKEGLKLIDQKENISVSSCLAPHLAFREKIYHFPIIKDSKLIALIKNNRTTYPLNKEKYQTEIEKFKTSEDFKIIYESDDLIILEKH